MDFEADDVSYVETIVSPERNSLITASVRPKSSCSLFTYCAPRYGTLLLQDDSATSSVHSYHNAITARPSYMLKRDKFLSRVNNVFGLALETATTTPSSGENYRDSIHSYSDTSYLQSMDISAETHFGRNTTQSFDTLPTSLSFSGKSPQETRYARMRRPFQRRNSHGRHKSGIKISHHIARPYPIAASMGRSLSVLVHGIMSTNAKPMQDANNDSLHASQDSEARFSWNEDTQSAWLGEDALSELRY